MPWLNSICVTSCSMMRDSHLLFFHVEHNTIKISLGNLCLIGDRPADLFTVCTEELDIEQLVLLDLRQRSNNTVGIKKG